MHDKVTDGIAWKNKMDTATSQAQPGEGVASKSKEVELKAVEAMWRQQCEKHLQKDAAGEKDGAEVMEEDDNDRHLFPRLRC